MIPRAVIRSLCVFCGSNSGSDPIYANAARDFGVLLAKSDIALIYGGGHVGLMGIVADAVLASLSYAFVALPGGLGTLEEIFEVWTWAQLGIHRKPLGFLDVAGFYAPLLSSLDRAVDAGFIRAQHRSMAIVDVDPASLLRRLAEYSPPVVEKWISAAET